MTLLCLKCLTHKVLLTANLPNEYMSDTPWPWGQLRPYSPRTDVSGCGCELTTKATLSFICAKLASAYFRPFQPCTLPCDLPFQPEDSQAPQAFLLLPHDTASALSCLPLNLLLLHLPVAQQFY